MESELFLDFGNKKLHNHLKRVKKSKRPICLFKLNKGWFRYNHSFSHLFGSKKKLDRYFIPNIIKTLKLIVLQKTLESQSGSATTQCVFRTKNATKIRFRCWSIPLQFKEGRGIQCIFHEMNNQDFDDLTDLDQLSVYGSQADKISTICNDEYNFSTEVSSCSSFFVDSRDGQMFDKNVGLKSTYSENINIKSNNLFVGEPQDKPKDFINYSTAVQILSHNIFENSENESKINGSQNRSNNKGSQNKSKSSSSENELMEQNEPTKKNKQKSQKKNKKMTIKLKTTEKADQGNEKHKKNHLKSNKKNNNSLNNNQKNKLNQEKPSTIEKKDAYNDFQKDYETNQEINFEILSIKELFQFCIKYINSYTNQMKLNYRDNDEVLSDLHKLNSIFIYSLNEKIKYIENLQIKLQIEKKNIEENYQKTNTHYQKRLQEFKKKQQAFKTNQILKSQLLIFKQIIKKLLKNGNDIQQMVTNLN
ncbi:wd repeat-containing protein [Anaeramoeba flamelloides]|uniref:Wd repeat-containing protein n=1 Tax=Anaeramoeba flamelloides TaxID=1746091 RepID=A0AAV7YQS0_9EUKA|nr:wd repeat-containing protein [Anaeramoeba flamelloides]